MKREVAAGAVRPYGALRVIFAEYVRFNRATAILKRRANVDWVFIFPWLYADADVLQFRFLNEETRNTRNGVAEGLASSEKTMPAPKLPYIIYAQEQF